MHMYMYMYMYMCTLYNYEHAICSIVNYKASDVQPITTVSDISMIRTLARFKLRLIMIPCVLY